MVPQRQRELRFYGKWRPLLARGLMSAQDKETAVRVRSGARAPSGWSLWSLLYSVACVRPGGQARCALSGASHFLTLNFRLAVSCALAGLARVLILMCPVGHTAPVRR